MIEVAFPSLISIILAIPIVGFIITLFYPRASQNLIRWTALVTSVITFVVSLFLLPGLSSDVGGLQWVERITWIPSANIQYAVGVDGLSILLVLLTTLISPIAVASSWTHIQDRIKEYYLFMLLLETAMVGVFVAQDLFLFYVFWEFTLVPMYFLIGIWGGERRTYAAIKFFLYTMVGSILMLLAILWLGITNDTFFLPDLIAAGVSSRITQIWLFLAFASAFAIKVPIWPLHSWLPDAHVEAPTAGSVILAGVLLKMGTYGFLRFNLPLFPEASRTFAPWIATLAVIGIIYGAWVSYAQTDVKKLVAYSSVSHLGFVMLGIFSFNAIGIEGAILQMVNHGLSTGALFLVVGMLYERRHTRELSAFGGLWKVTPVLGALSLIIALSSMGLPGLNGFVGEFTILLGAINSDMNFSFGFTALATIGIILAAVYILWMFQKVFMGPLDESSENASLLDLNGREVALLVPIIVLIFWIGLYPAPFFGLMDSSVGELVGHLGTALAAR